MSKDKVQTNLKLPAERARALDLAAAIEGKDKAQIVDEALQLREALMAPEYRELIRQAAVLSVSSDPEEQLRAVEALREEVPGATPGGSVSVTAVLARLRARARQSA